jgi:carbonic anhydrase
VNAQEQVFDLPKHLLFKMLGETDKILLHGWTYGLNSGYVTDLGVNMGSNSELDDDNSLTKISNTLLSKYKLAFLK